MSALNGGNTAETNKQVLGIDANLLLITPKQMSFLALMQISWVRTKFRLQYPSVCENRKPSCDKPAMGKLIVAEGMMSLTGMNADKRVKVRRRQTAFLAAVAKALAQTFRGDDSSLALSKEEAKKLPKNSNLRLVKAVVAVGDHPSAGTSAHWATINCCYWCIWCR